MKINGAALRLIRERTGVTVTEAARRAGVRQPTWSNWESGRRGASPANVGAICDALAIDDKTAVLAWPEERRA